MAIGKYRIKIKKNRDTVNVDYPQYSLIYKKDTRNPNRASYDILSAFIGNGDIVMEYNSDLHIELGGKKMQYAAELLNQIHTYQLEFVHKNNPSQHRVTLFGVPLENRKKAEADEVVAYVPNHIWKEETFVDVLPACGARYYITRGALDAGSILDTLQKMSEEEKTETFKLIVFDLTSFGQMGISTKYLGLDDLNELLGI